MARAPLPSPAPDGRAHPLTLWMWSVLRDRSEADRRLVFEALRRREGYTQSTEKQQQAERALRAFYAKEGSWPSRRRYDDWRDRQPDPKAWPSSSLIRG